MSNYYAMPQLENTGLLGSIRALCEGILETGSVDALLVPQRLPLGSMVQHTLVRDPASLGVVDPIAPVLPVNGGVLAARLTRQDPGGNVGVLLRPCEIRAFVELVKLRQGDRSRLLLLGIDCFGTFEPPVFKEWGAEDTETTARFYESMTASGLPPEGAPSLRRCCRACEFPTPEGADIQILLVGAGETGSCLVAETEAGEACMKALQFPTLEAPNGRSQTVEDLVSKRTASRDELFQEVESELLPLDRLLGELSSCINCYNCRDACPVCYCRSCVFDAQTFEHPSSQYLRWAKRKGAVKMPTDTLFFHATRLAHMSTSCVGCGQCSSACPMGIRVAEIFRTVSKRTQQVFDYIPGRALDEELPLATFREEELTPK